MQERAEQRCLREEGAVLVGCSSSGGTGTPWHVCLAAGGSRR